jgi:phage shock protein A
VRERKVLRRVSEDTDTVVTPALTKAVSKWRMWGPWLAAALAWAWSMSNTMGQKQVNNEVLAQTVSDLKLSVDGMKGQIEEVKQSQAEMKGTLTAINGWAQGVSKFQAGVQQGAAEALATPIPKQGHRAKH